MLLSILIFNLKNKSMKKMYRRSFVIAALLLTFSFILSSFSARWGGDSFTIHLNNKLILQQYLYADKAIKNIRLEKANYNDELRISFNHCGQVGKNRALAIRDSKGKVLKQWNFTDTNGSMTCKVKDILSLENGSASLQLFYSSSEMPKGQVLAAIVTENISTVKK